MEVEALVKQLLTVFTGRTDDYLKGDKRAFKALTEAAITKHLLGQERIGVYPTTHSGWMCLDFDGKNIPGDGSGIAFAQVVATRQALGCGLIERSKSGKGYHLWVFFEYPWPKVEEIKHLGRAVLQACGLPSDERESEGHPGVYPHPGKAAEEGGKGIGRTPYIPFHGYLNGSPTSAFLDILGQPLDNQLDPLSALERVAFQDLRDRFPIVAATIRKGKVARETAAPRHDIVRDLALKLRNHLPREATRILVRAIAKDYGLFDEGREQEVEGAISSAYGKPAIQVRTQFDVEQDIGATIYDIRNTPVKEFKNMKDVELDYLIEGLVLPQESILLVSPPGAGKSMVGMSLALSAAAGLPIFGKFDLVEPLRVLYVNEEMSDREFAKRVNKLANGMKLDLDTIADNLMVLPQQGLVLTPKNPIALNAFKEKVLDFKPHIVILDTFIALFGGEEKDSGEIRHWYNSVVVWLRQNIGCAVVVQHHIRKPSDDFNFRAVDDTSLLYMVRGSGDLPGAFERVLALWKFGDNPTDFGRLVNINVRNPKARSGDKCDNFDIVIDDTSLEATTVMASTGSKSPHAGQNDARVLHALNTFGGTVEKAALFVYLQEHNSCTERTARRWLTGAMRRQMCYLRGGSVIKN